MRLEQSEGGAEEERRLEAGDEASGGRAGALASTPGGVEPVEGFEQRSEVI